MTLAEALAVLVAGAAAGTINTVVGSGTLITFPVLLAVGYPPGTANVSNSIGLVPGSVSGSIGYRRELAGQRGRVLRLGAAALLGGIAGAVALLALPARAFETIVPVFIAIALVLIVVQPWLARRLSERPRRPHGGPAAYVAIFLAGVYGGYFGAAQGILLLAILGLTLDDDLQRLNALKNALATIPNGVSGIVFAIAADVAWLVVALIAAGAIVGAQLGARYGRRLPPAALRALIVAVGVTAIVRLV